MIWRFKTYRHKGHSVADANADKYRTKEEIKRIHGGKRSDRLLEEDA